MFGFLKKKKPVKTRHSAAIEKLKMLFEQELISRECLKKMGIRSLFIEDNKVKASISYEDACTCLDVVQIALDRFTVFEKKILEMADQVNDELFEAKKAAILQRKPMPKTHDFYTFDHIMEVFRSTAGITNDKPAPDSLQDAITVLNVTLKLFYIKTEIAIGMLHVKVSSANVSIR